MEIKTNKLFKDLQPALAVVNFTPTRGHGYGDFANEKYYPPVAPKKPKYEKTVFSTDYAYGTSPFRKSSQNPGFPSLKTDVNEENEFEMESPGSINSEDDSNEGTRNFRELAQRLNAKYEEKPIYRLRRQPHRDFSRNLKSTINDDAYEPTRDEEIFDDSVRKQLYKNLIICRNISASFHSFLPLFFSPTTTRTCPNWNSSAAKTITTRKVMTNGPTIEIGTETMRIRLKLNRMTIKKPFPGSKRHWNV